MTTARVRSVAGLPIAAAPDGTEVFPVIQGGATVGMTTGRILDAAAYRAGAAAGQIAAFQGALAGKANTSDLGAAAFRGVDTPNGVASFALVSGKQDQITPALTESAMNAWLDGLPTSWVGLPVRAWWNNGGTPTRVTGNV